MRRTLIFKSMLVSLVFLCFLGCATVPREVVDLSYVIGDDLTAVHASYRMLVIKYFDGLRNQVDGFIDNEWKPTYLKKFIKTGRLAELATDPDPAKVLSGVSLWVDFAMAAIEKIRKELLDPIDSDEQALLESVDQAFNQLYQANATVTAHLNSIRKVKEEEDRVLKALRLQDLRTTIQQSMSAASQRMNSAIDTVKQVEDKVGDIKDAVK